VLRLDGGLFFATADALEERICALASDQGEQLHALVLDLEGVSLIDSQGAAKLGELLAFAESAQLELRLARVKPMVTGVLEKDGVLQRLGRGHIHGNVHRAVEAQLAADRSAASPQRLPGKSS
jgi:SulP family sulfate permease